MVSHAVAHVLAMTVGWCWRRETGVHAVAYVLAMTVDWCWRRTSVHALVRVRQAASNVDAVVWGWRHGTGLHGQSPVSGMVDRVATGDDIS